MFQSRTHNCNELRIENVGEKVTLVGWMENVRSVSKNLAFIVLRDFYGTTQVVAENEDILSAISGLPSPSPERCASAPQKIQNRPLEI